MPSLSSHPIFKIDKGVYRSFKKDARRNVVAFKGTEVYVAVGSRVRCAELREWYAMDEEPQDGTHYQVLLSLIYLIADSRIPKRDISD